MEEVLPPKHHFVVVVAVFYSTVHGNPASGEDWKRQKENVAVSKCMDKLLKWEGKDVANEKNQQDIKITKKVGK